MQFEKSLEKLNTIVNQLEAGQLSLEETIKLYKEGSELISSCKKELDNAKQLVREYEAEGKNEA